MHFLKCGVRAAGVRMQFLAFPLERRFKVFGGEWRDEVEMNPRFLRRTLECVKEQAIFGVHMGMPPLKKSENTSSYGMR